MAELDEISFREKLWVHQPLTDFWQIGPGISDRLLKRGIHTMGDLARLSLMTEQVVLGLVEQGYVAEGVTLYVGYQILNREQLSAYYGPVKVNHYGRKVPPSVHGTGKLGGPTASLSRITQAVLQLYDRLVDKELQVRRMSIAAIRLCRKEEVAPQLTFYSDQQDDGRETALLEATIGLHRRYGKNAVVKGMDLLEAATTMERNGQIGGHRK